MSSTAVKGGDPVAAEVKRRRAWDAIAAAAIRYRAASRAWDAARARATAAGLDEAARSATTFPLEEETHAAEWALEDAIDAWSRLTGQAPDDL